MKLLALLADGLTHSGVELAERLEVSRMTVSNRVASWIAKGVDIEVMPARGYRLRQPLSLLNERDIQQMSLGLPVAIHVYETVSSTNDIAMSRLSAGEERLVCLAECQESGRGRRGRAWHAQPGESLCCSFGWRYDAGLQSLQGLSLAVGVAVMDALRSLSISGLGLKWPNDILSPSGKVGGVLIEVAGEAEGPCHVVVGIGLNVRHPKNLCGLVDQPIDSLEANAGRLLDRNTLAAAIIREVSNVLGRFIEQGFRPWQERWMAEDMLAGRQVLLSGGVELLEGVAAGVNAQGALLLEIKGVRNAYYGGELSLRPS